MAKKTKLVSTRTTVGNRPSGAEGTKNVSGQIRLREERLRKKYPEVHGKVVDFISHEVEDEMLYISIWFQDRTKFSLRCSCDMFVVGADFSQMEGGNLKIIREYMRPIAK